jgi:alpha-beta hydrolase superfamily lysophospholipase
VRHYNSTYEGSEGSELYYQAWLPGSNSRAVIIGVHGHGDHSGGLDSIISHLVPRGFGWYGLDLRGHGRSPGRRGHVESWSQFREDLKSFLNLVRDRERDLPVFLLGHSLGGLLSLDYAIQYPGDLQGIISISPALSYSGFSPATAVFLHLLATLKPEYEIRIQANYSKLTRDEGTARRLSRDTLRHDFITAQLGKELLKSGKRLKSGAHRLQVPLLMLYGTNDTLTPIEGMQDFYRSAASDSKECYAYPDTLHRPFDDLRRSQVLEDIYSWISRQLEGELLAENEQVG